MATRHFVMLLIVLVGCVGLKIGMDVDAQANLQIGLKYVGQCRSVLSNDSINTKGIVVEADKHIRLTLYKGDGEYAMAHVSYTRLIDDKFCSHIEGEG